MRPAGVYISAAHKSSGKTAVTVGLAAALEQRVIRVQVFKKGPDFIDPLWHTRSSGRPCYNLDFNTMNAAEIRRLFATRSHGAEVCLVEGNKGLYDGVDITGADDNAAMAKLLGLPVVLVIDASGITRGIAPLLLGYQQFDNAVNIAGVILNKVVSSRHEGKLRSVIEHHTDLRVLGAVARNRQMLAPERHLGLVPPEETPEVNSRIRQLANMVSSQVDMDALLEVTAHVKTAKSPAVTVASGLRIGVIRDAAFGFYYADDLEALEAAGCELVFINALKCAKLPKIDGLFIGGGFPETHIGSLAANVSLRRDIRTAIIAGLPVYAECGGLMYLSRSIRHGDDFGEMVGAIPGDVVMHEKPQGRGLVQLETTTNIPWGNGAGQRIAAHEFHYASLENLPPETAFAYRVRRGYGIDGENDGLVIHNTLASFSHLRHTEQSPWVDSFVAFIVDHNKRIMR